MNSRRLPFITFSCKLKVQLQASVERCADIQAHFYLKREKPVLKRVHCVVWKYLTNYFEFCKLTGAWQNIQRNKKLEVPRDSNTKKSINENISANERNRLSTGLYMRPSNRNHRCLCKHDRQHYQHWPHALVKRVDYFCFVFLRWLWSSTACFFLHLFLLHIIGIRVSLVC